MTPTGSATTPRSRPAAKRNRAAEPELSTATVDGVPVLWVPAPGLKRLVLSFRVGFMDEQIATRGLSHCCEHLALTQFKDEAFGVNGFVEAGRTVFFAQGTDRQLVSFAHRVTEALGELPHDRYEHERRVLRAESAARKSGDLDLLLRLRYGSRGPGLQGYPEYGLYQDDYDALQDWSHTRFTAANAVAWCSGPPPRGLRFALPPGDGRSIASAEPVDRLGPNFVRRAGGLALSFTVEAEPAQWLAGFVLELRLRDRLRHTTGASYSVQAVSQRLGLDRFHQSLFADVAPKQGQAVVDELDAVFEDLITNGHTKSDVATWVAGRQQAQLHPEWVLSYMESASQRLLFGGELSSAKSWDTNIRRVPPDDVSRAIADMRGDATFLIPRDAHAPSGTVALPEGSPSSVTGPAFRTKKGDTKLVVGPQGLCFTDVAKTTYTVKADECSAVLTWADSSQLFIAEDATTVTIQPSGWTDPARVAAALDETFGSLPHIRVGRRRTTPTGVRPKGYLEAIVTSLSPKAFATQSARVVIRRLVSVAFVAWLGMVPVIGFASALSPSGASDDRVSGLIVGVLLAAVTVFAGQRVLKSMRGPSASGTWLLDSAASHVDKRRVPDELPVTAAYTVGGLLLGWLATRELVSDWFVDECRPELEQFRAGAISGLDLYREWDGVLASDMLSARGEKFCRWYFANNQRRFTADIVAARGSHTTNYHIPDAPESQAAFNKRADEHFASWSRWPRR